VGYWGLVPPWTIGLWFSGSTGAEPMPALERKKKFKPGPPLPDKFLETPLSPTSLIICFTSSNVKSQKTIVFNYCFNNPYAINNIFAKKGKHMKFVT